MRSCCCQLDIERVWQNVVSLSDTRTFPNRYAHSETGVLAATYIYDKVSELVAASGRRDVELDLIPTSGYPQQTVRLRLGRETYHPSKEVIVLGAHLDTLKSEVYSFWGDFGLKEVNYYMPGADDDASGVATLLEIAQILLESNYNFDREIHIIWYAAEEQGLAGSRQVAKRYQSEEIPVIAALNFDMTGYLKKDELDTLWLINDYVDENLTNFIGQLAKFYADVSEVKRTECGYACSDHASWTMHGYRAAMPAETAFRETNPFIHSSLDSIEFLDKAQMSKFVKLGLAFAIELGL